MRMLIRIAALIGGLAGCTTTHFVFPDYRVAAEQRYRWPDGIEPSDVFTAAVQAIARHGGRSHYDRDVGVIQTDDEDTAPVLLSAYWDRPQDAKTSLARERRAALTLIVMDDSLDVKIFCGERDAGSEGWQRCDPDRVDADYADAIDALLPEIANEAAGRASVRAGHPVTWALAPVKSERIVNHKPAPAQRPTPGPTHRSADGE